MSPSCSCLSRRFSKLETQTLFKLPLLLWASDFLYVTFKSRVSVPTALWLSWKQAPVALITNTLEASFPGARSPGWQAWFGAWTPFFLERTAAVVITLPFGVGYPEAWVLSKSHVYPSCLAHCGLFFISLVVDLFFVSLQDIQIDGCCGNSCNFGVPMGESERGSPSSTILITPLYPVVIQLQNNESTWL